MAADITARRAALPTVQVVMATAHALLCFQRGAGVPAAVPRQGFLRTLSRVTLWDADAGGGDGERLCACGPVRDIGRETMRT